MYTVVPDNYVPIGRTTFEEFSMDHMDIALRSVPIKTRRNLYSLILVLSKNNYEKYYRKLLERIENFNKYQFLLNAPSITYAGISVIHDEEIPDNMIEVYGPLT